MAIPKDQCDTWRHQGATATAKATHEAVRKALDANTSSVKGQSYEVFLQGSYKNDTNIRADSDVDIVVQLNDIYYDDLSGLRPDELARYEKAKYPPTYTLDQFDTDVQKSLRSYFGKEQITPQNKCVNVAAANGRLKADVVVAAQYRRYERFSSWSDQAYVEGITFWGRTDLVQVVNYPKRHYDNGVTKNADGGNYKSSVRMIKNARRYLVAKSQLAAAVAPSYFVECWLYNIPNDRYVNDSAESFYNILDWLNRNPDWDQFVCQNWQQYLFGPLSVQWSKPSASQLQTALVGLWNNWNQ
jgi:hypothetical protein